jgi:uncharacterized protein YjbI with pentapeptide repeats
MIDDCPKNIFREVPSSEILDKILKGEDVDYDCVLIKEGLDLNGLDLPTQHIEREQIEITEETERTTFLPILPSEAKFVESEKIKITNSKFCGVIKFNNILFKNLIDFKGSQFRKGASFSGSQFNEDVDFCGAQFNGGADFRFAQFNGAIEFSDAQFSGYAYFWRARFRSVDFVGTRFRSVSFKEAQFSEDIYFTGAQFIGNAYFMEAKFSGDANFRWTQFNGVANFMKSQFSGDANFSETQFGGYAGFVGSQFSENANFIGTEFVGYTNFVGSQFGGDADFSEAEFNKKTNFESALFEKKIALDDSKIYNMNLCAQFDEESTISLKHSNFHRLEVHWEDIKDKFDEYHGSTYLALVKNYNELEWLKDADQCYYDYRKMAQLGKKEWYQTDSNDSIDKIIDKLIALCVGIYSHLEIVVEDFIWLSQRYPFNKFYRFNWSKLADHISWISCGYGVKVERLILWIFGSIFIFASLYRFFNGIAKVDSTGVVLVNNVNHVTNTASLIDCLYFSAMALTGQMPEGLHAFGICMYVATIERLFGYLVLALFVVVLARKLIR